MKNRLIKLQEKVIKKNLKLIWHTQGEGDEEEVKERKGLKISTPKKY